MLLGNKQLLGSNINSILRPFTSDQRAVDYSHIKYVEFYSINIV